MHWVISAEAMGALFFSSSAPTPDSDPKCNPPSDDFERTVQSVTVGFVTAFLSDGIIFMIFLVQRKRVVHRAVWTEARKERQRFWWRFRTHTFWVISILYTSCCQIYTWLFLANVREEDATKWLEGVLWTFFQDLIFKPFLVAVILTTMSSLMLCCRPSLKRKIQAEWEKGDKDKDDQGDQNDRDAEPEEQEASKPPEQEVHVIRASSEPEAEEAIEEVPAIVVSDRDTQVKLAPGYGTRTAMFSARFNARNKDTERKFRAVHKLLVKNHYNILMVDAGAGTSFGSMTLQYLNRLKRDTGIMLAVCTADYGERTESPFCTFYELKLAYEYSIQVLPLQVEDDRKPHPPCGEGHLDKDAEALAYIDAVFIPSLVGLDCRNKSVDQIAYEIAEVLRAGLVESEISI